MLKEFTLKKIIISIINIRYRNKIRSLLPSFLHKKSSYSQCGEDLILDHLLKNIFRLEAINFLDIGANHPFYLSNTALLHKKGSNGVLIEPDPHYATLLRDRRPRDQVLECGVHFSGEKNASFYIMDTPTLNTFSEKEMNRYVTMGHKLVNTIHVDLININNILATNQEFDFLNLDIEGLDFDVLKMIDWSKHRPKCICVETVCYDKDKEPVKQQEIINFMLNKEYFVYADTFINTIFVDKKAWSSRWAEGKVE
jgi:FkbM family methyltransferase